VNLLCCDEMWICCDEMCLRWDEMSCYCVLCCCVICFLTCSLTTPACADRGEWWSCERERVARSAVLRGRRHRSSTQHTTAHSAQHNTHTATHSSTTTTTTTIRRTPFSSTRFRFSFRFSIKQHREAPSLNQTNQRYTHPSWIHITVTPSTLHYITLHYTPNHIYLIWSPFTLFIQNYSFVVCFFHWHISGSHQQRHSNSSQSLKEKKMLKIKNSNNSSFFSSPL